MEQIELLIEDYKRRLKTAENMLKNWELPNNKERVKTKASCYRTFISELERAKASLNVA